MNIYKDYSIGDVAKMLNLPVHTIRFWTETFKHIVCLKRNGRRYYDEKAIDEFCKIVKSTRNYYTHYGTKENEVVEGKELIELNNALEIIINLIILRDLGFDEDEINEITREHPNFQILTIF